MTATDAPVDISDAAARVSNAATRLARLLRRQDTTQLTPTTRAVLGTIDRHGPVTLGDLAAREQVAPPTITKVVAALEEVGYVERIPDVADRRICRVALSPTGRKHLDADRRRRRAWLATRIAALPEDDQRKLFDAVTVLEDLVTQRTDARR